MAKFTHTTSLPGLMKKSLSTTMLNSTGQMLYLTKDHPQKLAVTREVIVKFQGEFGTESVG